MAENNEQIARLLERIVLLLNRQEGFNEEVNQLKKELQLFKKGEASLAFEDKKSVIEESTRK
jgi:hypothetical protein